MTRSVETEAGGPVSPQPQQSPNGTSVPSRRKRWMFFGAAFLILALVAVYLVGRAGGTSLSPTLTNPVSTAPSVPVVPVPSASAPVSVPVPTAPAASAIDWSAVDRNLMFADDELPAAGIHPLSDEQATWDGFSVVGYLNQIWTLQCQEPNLVSYRTTTLLVMADTVDPGSTIWSNCSEPGFTQPPSTGALYSNTATTLSFDTAVWQNRVLVPYHMTVMWRAETDPQYSGQNLGHWIITELTKK